MIDVIKFLAVSSSILMAIAFPLCLLHFVWVLLGKFLGIKNEDYFDSEDWKFQLKIYGLSFVCFCIFILLGSRG